jgi:hypothetical protein
MGSFCCHLAMECAYGEDHQEDTVTGFEMREMYKTGVRIRILKVRIEHRAKME